MAFKIGDRGQVILLPSSIEEFVEQTDPVRAYDAIVDSMDFVELGLDLDGSKMGPSSYNPVSMLKLLVYGYSYGIRSSRKLERALYHNFSFIWIAGGLKPDHKTIARFRKDNEKALQKVLKQTVRICLKIELIDGNCFFVDGTKMRGSASINNTYSEEGLQKLLERIDDDIDSLMAKCNEIDDKESGSFVKVKKDIQKAQNLKDKISQAKKALKKSDRKKINTTDHDAVNMKGRQGSHAGFNGQAVVDEKHGLIVSSDVVSENNDLNQFTKQIENANENVGKKCKISVGDAGYSSVDDIAKMKEDIDVIVPNPKQISSESSKKKNKPFAKEKFTYDEVNDIYICPEGNALKYNRYIKKDNNSIYRIEDLNLCRECKFYGICTKDKYGRTIRRLKNEKLKQKLASRYDSEEGKKIYARRKEVAELPFGHIKRNLGAGYFLLRGLKAVNAEFSILTGCFNVARMITLLGGVPGLVAALKLI